MNEYDRLHLVNLAIQKTAALKAVDIEFRLPKPSYTTTTLAYLEEKYPQHQFTIIMGSDSLQNLEKWKNAEKIMNNYPIQVYTRPGFSAVQPNVKQLTVLQAPLLEISATHIRELIQEGKSIRYLVPDTVCDEIENAGYYKLKNPTE